VMRTSENLLDLLRMIVPNSNCRVSTRRSNNAVFQEGKVKHWSRMTTKSYFCFVLFKSKSLNSVVTTSCKNILVLNNY